MGLGQWDELGCTVKLGLTTEYTGRLTCIIDLGTSPEDLPTIIVSGYDKIPAQTAIKILVTNIKTLPSTRTADIKIGVELIYKELGESAFIYEPTPPELPDNTNAAYTGALSSDPMVITVDGDETVLGKTSYTFTVTSGASGIDTVGYLALQFPEDFFEKYSDFSGVTCSEGTTPNPCTVYIFGVSNMIYIQFSVAIAASTEFTFTIHDLINPAYSFYDIVKITGFSQVGALLARIQETLYEFTLNREILPCNHFTEATSVADSYIGGQNDVTFQIDFITGHKIPEDGAISVTFPESYDINLLNLGASCEPYNFDYSYSESEPYCKIGSAKRIDLYLNGYELD